MAPSRILDSSTQRLSNKDERDTMEDEHDYGIDRAIPEVLVTRQRLSFLADPTKTRLEHAGQ